MQYCMHLRLINPVKDNELNLNKIQGGAGPKPVILERSTLLSYKQKQASNKKNNKPLNESVVQSVSRSVNQSIKQP